MIATGVRIVDGQVPSVHTFEMLKHLSSSWRVRPGSEVNLLAKIKPGKKLANQPSFNLVNLELDASSKIVELEASIRII